jgi:hypothetical protein
MQWMEDGEGRGELELHLMQFLPLIVSRSLCNMRAGSRSFVMLGAAVEATVRLRDMGMFCLLGSQHVRDRWKQGQFALQSSVLHS